MSTWSLEMFYDLAEQVFILKISIWRPERENREKIQSVAILITNIAYEFIGDMEELMACVGH